MTARLASSVLDPGTPLRAEPILAVGPPVPYLPELLVAEAAA
ncbi:hypothetical protein ACFORO_01465 [Amycolatopsis halotolerans]|uniref:Uncharacterized protein n=1 Tax=Amycolatopsis halotolerans TaxID=330083 RepID=A0ABV7Q9A7_9PSEU